MFARSASFAVVLAGLSLTSFASLAQVAPGMSIPLPPASIGSGTLVQSDPAVQAQTNMRIERLEGELRNMTGQMEQLMFQMRQLQDELTRAREDTEFRLRELEGSAPSQRGSVDFSDETLRQALLSREQGAAPRDLGTLSLDASGQPLAATLGATDPNGPLDLSTLTLNGDPQARPQAPLADVMGSVDAGTALSPSDAYELGYGLVLRGDYQQAVVTFDDFLARYASDPLRPNAHFWLGESHFALGNYTPAAEQFLTVFNQYPEDVKVPDALLKLGMSLQRLGAQQQACATFNKLVSDYPRAPQIVLDTARTQQGVAGC